MKQKSRTCRQEVLQKPLVVEVLLQEVVYCTEEVGHSNYTLRHPISPHDPPTSDTLASVGMRSSRP